MVVPACMEISTKRTPVRPAAGPSGNLRANADVGSLFTPYISCVARISLRNQAGPGAAVCMRKASSYGGDPRCDFLVASFLQAAMVKLRLRSSRPLIFASHPGGFESTGWGRPSERTSRPDTSKAEIHSRTVRNCRCFRGPTTERRTPASSAIRCRVRKRPRTHGGSARPAGCRSVEEAGRDDG